MKIALICPKLKQKGGAEKIALLLADKLVDHGHEVTVFTRSFNEGLWGAVGSQSFGVRFVHLKRVPKPLRKIWSGIFLGWRLKGFDVVNPHNYPSYVWSAYARRLYPHFPPVVWFCHEPPRSLYYHLTETHKPHLFRDDFRRRKILHRLYVFLRPWRKRWERMVENWAVRQCQKVLTNSTHSASLVQKIYGIQADPCHLGIPLQTHPQNKNTAKERYACAVTRLTFHKNVDTILKAVAVMTGEKKIADFRLKVIGKGPEEMSLKMLAQSLGITPYVQFLGFLPERELQRHYAQAEFVVYVPLNEPFGLVTIEAMAHGTPVIGTRDAGPAEVIEDGGSGLVVDPEDEHQLAEAMVKLWSDPDLCRQLGQKGRQRVEEYYTDEAFVRRFLSLIEDL